MRALCTKLNPAWFKRWTASVALLLAAGTLQAQDEIVLGHHLMSWLEGGAELRLRGEMETFLVYGSAQRASGTFERVRVGLRATPAEWLHFTVQFQDARTLSGPVEIVREYQDNHTDLQYAFVDLDSETGATWRIRAGRQALAFGDERLIGSDASWDNRAQRYDGVRATVKWRQWHWDVFSATPTDILSNSMDRFTSPERVTGVYGSWSQDVAAVEPYVLWNKISEEHSNLVTPGFRLTARLVKRMDAVVENALQRGQSSGLTVSAWASYWELGYRAGKLETAPRLVLSYSYASGDKNPNDRRIGTFNDLHPAGYNECGFLEPFSWRNIRDLRFGGAWTSPNNWRLTANAHAYWLATTKDGVYVDQGPYVVYNPGAQSSRLGSRLLVMAQHRVTAHSDLSFGYAKFFPAEYLKDAMSMSHSAFVSITIRL